MGAEGRVGWVQRPDGSRTVTGKLAAGTEMGEEDQCEVLSPNTWSYINTVEI